MGRGRRTRADRAWTPQATTVALTIALLLGSIPVAGALGAGPTEDPRRAGPTASLPCEPGQPAPLASPFDADRRRPVQGGCRSWQSRSAPADAVALEPIDDGETFLHARDDDGRIVVERRQARTGSVEWRTQLQAPGDVGRLSFLAAEASDHVYVGWEHDDQGADRPRAELGGTDFSPGGLARLSLATGTLDWHRSPGSAGLGLAAEQDTLYYAYTEGGYLRFDDGDLEEDNATLVVTAVDPSTGTTRWTNETDAWWTSHAYDDVGPDSSSSCVDGPAHVTVSDGIAYVARGQRCTGVPIVVAGFAPDGEMAFLSSYPDEHADTAWGEGRIWGSGLAVHPNGRILYATASDFRPANAWAEAETKAGAIVAIDLFSGDVLWGWSASGETWVGDTYNGGDCGRWRSACFADHGIHDLAVTPRGHVVLVGFDEMHGTNHPGLEGQLVVLDGLTGQPIGRERITPSITDAVEMETSGHAFDARVDIGPDGVVAFGAYRTSQEVRLVGFPLSADRAGPLWTAKLPEASDRSHVLDLAVGPETVVGAGTSDTDQATVSGPPSQVSGYERGLVDRTLASIQTDVVGTGSPDDASRRASSAATGLVHGKRALQGVPTVEVNATDRVHAEVNISRPGEYYLLVEGVTPHQAYALDALPISQRGVDAGWSGTCEDDSEEDCEQGASDRCLEPLGANLGAGGSGWLEVCRQTDEGACETLIGRDSLIDQGRDLVLPCEQPGGVACGNGTVLVQRHPTWRRKCWGTGREDPVTLARADAPAGEANDTDAGTVVFGPVALTEGRYTVLKADEPWYDSGTLVSNCVEGIVRSWSSSGELAACIEVHVDRSQPAPSAPARPAEASGGVASGTTGTASQGGSGSDEQCPSRWKTEVREIPLRIFDAVANESDRDERIWRADVLYLTFAARLAADRYGCYIEDFDVRDARVRYDLHGERLFDGGKEWTAVIGVLGNCAPSWHVGCGGDEGSLMLRRPTVYLPDKTEGDGRLEVEAVHHAGHSESEEDFEESLQDLVVDVVSFGSGKPIDIFLEMAEALGYAKDELLPAWGDPFAGDDYPTYECGLGCEEWGIVQGAQAAEYVHRPFLRPYGCETIRYPVKAGIQELFHAWADDGSGQGGTYYHQAFPLDLLERRIEVQIDERC